MYVRNNCYVPELSLTSAFNHSLPPSMSLSLQLFLSLYLSKTFLQVYPPLLSIYFTLSLSYPLSLTVSFSVSLAFSILLYYHLILPNRSPPLSHCLISFSFCFLTLSVSLNDSIRYLSDCLLLYLTDYLFPTLFPPCHPNISSLNQTLYNRDALAVRIKYT